MEWSYQFVSIWLQFLFLLTPFFVLSMFLSMTKEMASLEKRRLAIKVTVASMLISFILLFFGNWIFKTLGITLDAFRIGGGALLFLSGVSLVNGAAASARLPDQDTSDIAVVPLATPVTIGPGTTAALLVLGAERTGIEQKLIGCLGLFLALLCMGIMLLFASRVERFLGRRGITILSKLTGLVLAALAAQIMFTGIQAFLVQK